MTTPATLAVYQADIGPLQGRWARAWALAAGGQKDLTVERARQAVLAGAVSRAPDDALPLLAEDTQVLPLGETGDELRARIAAAWETWRWAGTRTALVVVAGLLAFDPTIVTAHDLGLSPWARWWLWAPRKATRDDPWDDAGDYDDGGTWDSTLTTVFVDRIRRSFRQVSNAHDRGFVRLTFGSVAFYDDGGTWDGAEIDESLPDSDLWSESPAFVEIPV